MRKTVLLIEDDSDEVLLAKRAFQKAEPDVILLVAESGEQACRMLYHDFEAALPQLILLDLQMQGRDGLSVLRELRARPLTRSLPVVLLTSSDEPGDIAVAYTCGANSYLRKPVDFDLFVLLVKDICRYWLGHNQLPLLGALP